MNTTLPWQPNNSPRRGILTQKYVYFPPLSLSFLLIFFDNEKESTELKY